MGRPWRRISLCSIDAWTLAPSVRFFSLGARRVQAALLASPRLAGTEVDLVASGPTDAASLAARIEAQDPDLVGLSGYVWSFPTLVEVALRLKEARPERVVVLGGPSARPEMLALPRWRDAGRALDLLVLGEGEAIMERIAAEGAHTPDDFANIGGVALPGPDGWRKVGEPSRESDLGALPSPYVMGLAPRETVAHIESFRGCPLACNFCQWGDPSQSTRVFPKDYLARELAAVREGGHSEIVLTDAGLNLNPRALRNLAAAEAEVRVLRDTPFSFEIYPLGISAEVARFLAQVHVSDIGIGLQSYDRAVLERLHRPFDADRFEKTVLQAAAFGPVTIEIIHGLPGDSPASFWSTLDRARRLPAHVRIFPCLVLPDALMTRMPAGCTADFDPVSLQVRSATGWPESELRGSAERLTALVEREGGTAYQGQWWQLFRPGIASTLGRRASASMLPSSGGGNRPGDDSPPAPVGLAEAHPLRAILGAELALATHEAWSLEEVEPGTPGWVLRVSTPAGRLLLDVAAAEPGDRAFCQVGRVALSYRSDNRAISDRELAELPGLARRLSGVLHDLVELPRPAPRPFLPLTPG